MDIVHLFQNLPSTFSFLLGIDGHLARVIVSLVTFNFSLKNKILWVAHLCPCVKGDHIELFQFLSELRHSNCSSGFPTVQLLFQKYFIIWVQVFPIVRFPLQRDVCREFVLLSVNMSFPLCVGLSDNSLAYENYFEKC